MPKKPSKPILILLVVLAVVGVWAVLNPPPTTTTAPKRVLVTSSQSTGGADSEGVTQEDIDAHFAHYTGGARDPFVPGVALLSPQDQAGALFGKTGDHGNWALTGINSINGIASAVIENNTSGDSVFLEQGDHWNGLKVQSIESDSVIFQNALGQKTTLTFSQPDDKSNGPNGASVAAGSSAVPSLSAITQLPPLPALAQPDTAQPADMAQPGMHFHHHNTQRALYHFAAHAPAE